jgi:hypothetical protein
MMPSGSVEFGELPADETENQPKVPHRAGVMRAAGE